MNTTSKTNELQLKIVHAAAQLFARQGYRGTSTREIARIAEVSENTLFRHFAHKEEIFWAALHSCLGGLRLRRDLLESIVECAPPDIVLPQLVTQLVDTATLKPDALRLVAVGLIELNRKTQQLCFEYFAPAFATLHDYLVKNMESGRIRAVNPTMVTAALATVVMVHHQFSKTLFGAESGYNENREAIQSYTRFWLEMLLPHGNQRLATP